MEIIAHRPRRSRGLVDVAHAIASGADRVELDVLSLDGRLVVAHDPREARRHGTPTLEAALDLITPSDCGLLADVKGLDAAAALSAALVALDLGARTVVSGGLESVAVAASPGRALRAWTLPTGRRAQPGAAAGPLGWATRAACRRVQAAATTALEAGRCDAVCADRRFVGPGLVTAVRAAGGRLLVWTVDRPAEVRQLRKLGVDGVITHDPVGARRALEA